MVSTPAAPELEQHPHTARLKGIAAMLVAVAAFAVMDTLLKMMSQHYPVMQVTALRGAAALPFMILPALFMGRAADLRPVRWSWHLMRGFLMTLALSAFVYALRLLSLADAYAIFMSAPLIVTALSVPLLKEHVGWRRWVAIGVGMCGVLTMLRPSGSGLMTFGALAAFAAAVGYAFSVMTVRVLTRTNTTASVAMWPIVVTTIVTGAIAVPGWVPVRVEHWGWIVGMGAAGALAIRLLTEAFRAAPATVVTPFEYTALLWGVAIDWALWDKLPSARVCAGGGLVIASGLYLIWRERQLRLESAPATTTVRQSSG